MTEVLSSYQSRERTTHAPLIDNAPDALQIETVDRLVGRGEEIDALYLQEHPSATEQDLANNRHHAVNALLHERGMEFGDTDQEQAQYKLAYETYERALGHTPSTWLYLSEADGTLRPRDITYASIAKQYNQQQIITPSPVHEAITEIKETDASSLPPVGESIFELTSESSQESTHRSDAAEVPASATDTPAPRHRAERSVFDGLDEATVEAISDDVAEVMDNYAQKVAKRSKSIIENSKTGNDIEATGNELSELLAGLATEMYLELKAQGTDKAVIAAQIDEFIENMTERTLSKVEQHRMEEYNNSRPYMQKMYDTWANWSDDKKLKGGRGKKMAVMAGGGAALGLALGPLVGAVGVGVLTGAVAVAGTRSIGRHLANGFMKKRDKRFAAAQTDEMRTDLDKIYQQNDAEAAKRREAGEAAAADKKVPERNIDLIEFVNQRSHEYRKRNRNRVLAGTAIAMSVGLLSATAADALEHVDWRFGRLGDIDWKNPFGGIDITKPDVGRAPSFNDRDGDGVPDWRDFDGSKVDHDLDDDHIINRLDHDRDGDGILNRFDHTPNRVTHAELSTNLIQVHELSHAARFISPGEGGFQTLQEMNVPEEKWETVWREAGKALHRQGKTYMMDDGRWGWDHTMRLSNSDLQVIAKAAQRHGVNL